MSVSPPEKNVSIDSIWSIFLIFLRLGLTSFGGPVAHLAYFREEFIARRKWMSEHSYADVVALCQFLPGPASSQVGIALGLSRAGCWGAIAAWAGFTLPSALLMSLFGLSIANWGNVIPFGLLHGLKVVAVAVVAQAVWSMARNLCTDTIRISIAAVATCLALTFSSALGQIMVIVVAAIAGLSLLKPTSNTHYDTLPISFKQRHGIVLLILFFGLLLGLPTIAQIWPNSYLVMASAFYRVGALVFGGGHVMLPLLQAATVSNGWVNNDTFLAGYGAAQALPGPLSTFAAFLGTSMSWSTHPVMAAAICLTAIFLPSFLLVLGVMPFWLQLRRNRSMQAALGGINAAVVGLLLAALYQPVWTSAILKPADFGLLILAWVALMFWKLPTWLVVIACGVAAWALSVVM